MKIHLSLVFVATALSLASTGYCASTGQPFYGDPPDDHHPWAVHDWNRPQPKLVTPGTFSTQEQPGTPPSDAIILFDGTDLSRWEADQGEGIPTKWVIRDGAMECVPGSGYIRTKEKFGDCQLHVEWAAPTKIEGESQGRGNSGVFLMGLVEVQVLNNYENPTYADGFAASVYGVMPPFANPLRAPGQWQTYDIVFRRPIYKDGVAVDPGSVTVFLNGVLMQDHTRLEGPTGHMARAKPGPFPEVGPLKLQDHGNPVRFRNIWYRPLPPDVVEGGTDGYLSTEATMAKRSEIAAAIRQDAASMTGNPVKALLRWNESLVYEHNDQAAEQAQKLAEQYITDIKQLSPEQLSARKDEILRVRDAYRYMAKWKILPADSTAKVQIDQIVRENHLEKKSGSGH